MKLKNTLTGTIKSIDLSQDFNMYVCGPTVYNDMHIGNARPIITYDLLHRVLKYLGVKVNFVHNFTDIDDKIINKAIKEKTTEKIIATKYINKYLKNLKDMNILELTSLPTVTNNMDAIIIFIKKLIDKNMAYEKNGDVFFKVNSLKEYGEISKVDIKHLKEEEINFNKKHSVDFSLWKKTTKGIVFDSPWGPGRPGWHTECVALISKIFDKTINLHGGGTDLKFPHHENENAQWKAINNSELATIWSHVGHLNFNNEKMSKSLGNIITINDFIKNYSSNHLRMLMFMSSYTSPMDINDKVLIFVDKEILKIKTLIFKGYYELSSKNIKIKLSEKIINKVIRELEDDLNTPNAFTELNERQKKLNQLLKNDIEKFNDKFIELINTYNFMGFKFNLDFINNKIKKYIILQNSENYKKADVLRTEIMMTL